MERVDSTGRPLYPWEVVSHTPAAEAPEAPVAVEEESADVELDADGSDDE